MDSILAASPLLVPYTPTLAALAVLSILVLVQGFAAGALGYGTGEEIVGMPLKGDHSKRSFRVIRTYGNSTENFPALAASAVLAIVVGVAPLLVNWLVGLHVVCRLLFGAIYYAGWGKAQGGPRTIVYVIGLLLNVVLAAAVIVVLVF